MFGRNVGADRRGLTPVVGIVLLIVITLALASTVAAYAVGLGDSAPRPKAPTVAVGFDYGAEPTGNDELAITHRSGNPIDPSNLYVLVEGATCAASGADPNGRYSAGAFPEISGPVRAGMTMTVDGDSPVDCSGDQLDLRGATVHVVWDPGTESTSALRIWQGPG